MSSTSAVIDPPDSGPERERSLSTSLCIGFGVGTVGVSVMLNTVSAFFPALMSTVLGQSTEIAGILLTASKLYDIAADFVIGSMSDRTRSRWGRRRPFLLAGALLGSLSFLLIFNPPALEGWGLAAYMGAMLVIYSTGYSLFNVPYLAMPAEMTQAYHERTRLLSYRTFFVSVGQLIAFTGSASILQALGRGERAYSALGMILAAVVLAAQLSAFFGTRNAHRVEPATTPDRLGALGQLRLALENKPLVLLLSVKACQLLSLAVNSGAFLLFLLNVLKADYKGQAQFSVVGNIAIAVSMPIWTRIAKRFGKRATYIGASCLYVLGVLSWWVAPQVGAGSMLDWPMSAGVIGFAVRAIVLGVAGGGMLLMGISMLPDTMEWDRRRTGLRREGIFSSAYAIVEKSAFAIGPLIIGSLIAAAGYIPTKGGQLVEQPAAAVTMLYVAVSLIPATLTAISIVLLCFYDLTEAKLKSLVAPVAEVPDPNPAV